MVEPSFKTLVVHAGAAAEDGSAHGALSVPIYNASVFAFGDAEEAAEIHNERRPGYYYGRLGNPTTEALEHAIATLENTESGVAFASGMAAVAATVLTNVKTGDHIVAPAAMYSTAMNFFVHLKERFAIDVDFVEASDAENYASAVRPNTRLFWIESPSNPTLTVSDISRITEIARQHNIVTAADNTFATPCLQRPAELGVEIVVHSGTKYLGGHSDVTAGLIATTRTHAAELRKTAIKLYGGTLAPQAAWLVLRGIKTLALRIAAQCDNAYALANMLQGDARAARTYYPGLADHPNNHIARRQMRAFGGMVAFDLGTIETGKAFINAVRLCKRATSLGGVETIVQHSASMTHATIPREVRLQAGITDGLIRLSVGIEDIGDLTADIRQALDASANA